MTRLALGTVQFGLDYGIANRRGRPSLHEAGRILEVARGFGIDLLDSAVAYGASEQVLGDLGVSDFKVVTKLPPLPEGMSDAADWVERELTASLARLRLGSVHGLLLHRSTDLNGRHGRDVAEGMLRVRASGLAEKIGVSIYDPAELDEVISLMPLDLVQTPINLLDRRLERSGWLRRLHEDGVEIHTRSTFLQGLLLLPRREIPARFERWSALWDSWHGELLQHSVPPTAACLSYPLSLPGVSRVVVGVDAAEQLEALALATWNPPDIREWPSFATDDAMLINPSNWNRL